MRAHVFRSLMQAAVLLGLGTGCRSPVDVDGVVVASIVGPSLRIENSSSAPVYFHAFERETAAAVNWLPCVEGPNCLVIPAESTTTIPLTSIYGFHSTSEEVIVYWWHRMPGPPLITYRPGEIHSVIARRWGEI